MAARPKIRAKKEKANAILDAFDTDEQLGMIFDVIANGYALDKAKQYKNRSVQSDGLYNYCIDNGLHYLTIFNYIQNDPALSQQHDAAKRARGQRLIDEALYIADEPVDDMVQVVDKKTRIDTRLKVAKSEFREAYGDKLEVTNMTIDLTSIIEEGRKRLEKAIQGEVIGKD